MTTRKATATARPSAAQRSLAAKGKKAAAKKRSTLDSRSHRTLHPLPEDVRCSEDVCSRGEGNETPPHSGIPLASILLHVSRRTEGSRARIAPISTGSSERTSPDARQSRGGGARRGGGAAERGEEQAAGGVTPAARDFAVGYFTDAV